MTLPNRVNPFGGLFADPARGTFTGNRGVIHDPETRTPTGRRWSRKAWICCALTYQDRKRDVWGRNGPGGSAGWTELFFADEVTALAAGHRFGEAPRGLVHIGQAGRVGQQVAQVGIEEPRRVIRRHAARRQHAAQQFGQVELLGNGHGEALPAGAKPVAPGPAGG